jgi:hypothetical protein
VIVAKSGGRVSTYRWLKSPIFDIFDIFFAYPNPSRKNIYYTCVSDVAKIMNQGISSLDIIILPVTRKILIDKHWWWPFRPIGYIPWVGWYLSLVSLQSQFQVLQREHQQIECAFFKPELLVEGVKVWEICWVWCSVVYQRVASYLLSHCPHPTFTSPNSNTVKNNIVCRNIMMWSHNNCKIVE